MLSVQLQYWNLVESQRHNVAQEAETNRHNVVTEQETGRHNKVDEQLGYDSLAENIRHNKAQEQYWQDSLSESRRHNQAAEGVAYYEAETGRMNAFTNQENAVTNRLNYGVNAMNAETSRYNAVMSAALGWDANMIAQQNADTNAARQKADAQIGRLNSLTNSTNASVNQERNEIDWARQNAYQADVQSQIERRDHQNSTDTWHSVNESINTGVNAVDTIVDDIPQIKGVAQEMQWNSVLKGLSKGE